MEPHEIFFHTRIMLLRAKEHLVSSFQYIYTMTKLKNTRSMRCYLFKIVTFFIYVLYVGQIFMKRSNYDVLGF